MRAQLLRGLQRATRHASAPPQILPRAYAADIDELGKLLAGNQAPESRPGDYLSEQDGIVTIRRAGGAYVMSFPRAVYDELTSKGTATSPGDAEIEPMP